MTKKTRAELELEVARLSGEVAGLRAALETMMRFMQPVQAMPQVLPVMPYPVGPTTVPPYQPPTWPGIVGPLCPDWIVTMTDAERMAFIATAPKMATGVVTGISLDFSAGGDGVLRRSAS